MPFVAEILPTAYKLSLHDIYSTANLRKVQFNVGNKGN